MIMRKTSIYITSIGHKTIASIDLLVLLHCIVGYFITIESLALWSVVDYLYKLIGCILYYDDV